MVILFILSKNFSSQETNLESIAGSGGIFQVWDNKGGSISVLHNLIMSYNFIRSENESGPQLMLLVLNHLIIKALLLYGGKKLDTIKIILYRM